MARAKQSLKRREDALSRERIVNASIKLLDDMGEDGLTFRALATRLATGAGAIYWHIESREELLVAAADTVATRTLTDSEAGASPKKAIQKIALGVFDMIDAHPWVGSQLTRNPPTTAMLRIFERIGHQVQALKTPSGIQFTAATVLGGYIIGESCQNAANRRPGARHSNRTKFLEQIAAQWKDLDASEFPFIRSLASQLRKHDDRAEFLGGIDLILAGIAAGSR